MTPAPLSKPMPLVTQASVFEAAARVAARTHRPPTVRAIRQELGGGSHEAILPYLRDYTAPATTEWCEEIRETLGATCATVDLSYDEIRLLATVRPVPERVSDARRLTSRAENSLVSAAGALARRYGCQSRLLPDGGLAMVFEA